MNNRPPRELAGIPREGAVVAGKYLVEHVLGRGGMGVVVCAMHVPLRQRVALKFLSPSALLIAGAKERFLREAQAAAAIQSDHVAKILDVGVHETGVPYIVMEYLVGIDLAQLLKQRGQLPVSEAIDYVLQTCSALAEAHRLGIVHRDLKPANLFCAQRATGSSFIKILDFGLSKMTHNNAGLLHDIHLTSTELVAGSPHYMSPEQIRSLKHVDARTDVWALGVILYQLVTGQHPFSGETAGAVLAKIAADAPTPIEALVPDVSLNVRTAIAGCLEKDLSKRLRSVDDLVNTLTGCSLEASRTPFSMGHAAVRPNSKRLPLDAVNRTSMIDSSLATSGSWGTKPQANVIHSNRGRVLVVAIGAAFVLAAFSVLVLRFRASPDMNGGASATVQKAAFSTASAVAVGHLTSTAPEQKLEPETIPPTRKVESAMTTLPAPPSASAFESPALRPKPSLDTVATVAQMGSSTAPNGEPIQRKPSTSIPNTIAPAPRASAPRTTTPSRNSNPVTKKQDVTDLWQ